MKSAIACLCVFALLACVGAQRTRFSGINLAVAEFKPNILPGTYDVDYTYPETSEVDYWIKKGFNTFRIPFLWERLQRKTGQTFDVTELSHLDDIVEYITDTKKSYAIIDPHNYARYFGDVVGVDIPSTVLADFWNRLAAHYQPNARVIFGLMNEPHTMPTETWVAAANAAIAAIRLTGATNLILVPGNSYTGAHSWLESSYGTSNSIAMLNITDTGKNMAIEVHQYLDVDSSGTVAACVNSTVGSERLKDFTTWCKKYGYKAFLAELGGGTDATCLAAIDDMLSYVSKNTDVYIGWTYWAGGQWWGDYFTSVYPDNNKDAKQTSILTRYTPNGNDPDLAAGHVMSSNIVAIAVLAVIVLMLSF